MINISLFLGRGEPKRSSHIHEFCLSTRKSACLLVHTFITQHFTNVELIHKVHSFVDYCFEPSFPEKMLLHPFRDNGQFYQWCHFNGNLMVSNNISKVFFRPFSFHITAIYIEPCVQSQFSGICD